MGLKQLLSRIDVRPRLPSGLGRRANRVGPALAEGWELGLGLGTGAGWTPLSYGEYYARSAPVYAAIKLRQDAVASVPLRVCGPEGRPVEPEHPARRLLDRPNPFWTRGDLWRATETYLGLWAPPTGGWSATTAGSLSRCGRSGRQGASSPRTRTSTSRGSSTWVGAGSSSRTRRTTWSG